MIKSYKDLVVWEKSIALVEKIYQLTIKFPATEQWGLCSQMRRSSISIPSNIAEGFGRQATGEYRHHLSYSRGSARNTNNHCRKTIYVEKSFLTAKIMATYFP